MWSFFFLQDYAFLASSQKYVASKFSTLGSLFRFILWIVLCYLFITYLFILGHKRKACILYSIKSHKWELSHPWQFYNVTFRSLLF